MKRIAVLMTCFNRQEKTLACLESLRQVLVPEGMELHLYLVDDGTDGTGAAVVSRWQNAVVSYGDGNLYWNGGMRLAFEAAIATGFDYYLWLNDDTMLRADALTSLLNTQEEMLAGTGREGIAVGSVNDPVSGRATYGGVERVSRWRPMRFSLVMPQGKSLPCDTMNGNCVLISAQVARSIGGLDRDFAHAMGDFDYGLRAQKAGFPLRVASGWVGTCSNNPVSGTHFDSSLPFAARWKKIMHPKGLPPRSWGRLTRRHAGLLWPIHFVWPYARLILTSFLRNTPGAKAQRAGGQP